MVTREDFKLMAVGKYTLGKPSVKSEDYLLYMEAALYAFDYTTKAVKNDESLNSKEGSFSTRSEGSARLQEQSTSGGVSPICEQEQH